MVFLEVAENLRNVKYVLCFRKQRQRVKIISLHCNIKHKCGVELKLLCMLSSALDTGQFESQIAPLPMKKYWDRLGHDRDGED